MSKDLRDAMEKIEQNKLAENFISYQHHHQLVFFLPSEKLVRSAKSTKSLAFPKQVPTDELFRSMDMGSRIHHELASLTFIDNESAEARNPNHFLFESSVIKP